MLCRFGRFMKAIYGRSHMFFIAFLEHIAGIEVMNSFTFSLFAVSVYISLIELDRIKWVNKIGLLSVRIEISSENPVWLGLASFLGWNIQRTFVRVSLILVKMFVSVLGAFYCEKFRFKTLIIRNAFQFCINCKIFLSSILVWCMCLTFFLNYKHSRQNFWKGNPNKFFALCLNIRESFVKWVFYDFLMAILFQRDYSFLHEGLKFTMLECIFIPWNWEGFAHYSKIFSRGWNPGVLWSFKQSELL